ncbi:SsgA family sporulation/cell division regulator [Kitasatospora sp. NPDC088351]|uniref:SsgA family sporulation/cell division regulator n=1 Tax=unclassified Kitasatospora TaxID=2633591 RepID=UPI003429CB0E
MAQIIEDFIEACIVGPRPRPVLMAVRYDPGDPFALSLGFGANASAEPEGSLSWTAARELFGTGLRAPAGLGDLRVGPWSPDLVGVEFHGDEGCAVVVLPARDLADFLARTYDEVAPGAEHRLVRWPDTVAELVGESG